MKTLSSYIELLRPLNGFMVGLAVVIGYLISLEETKSMVLEEVLHGYLTGFFISSSIMIFNDIIDLPIDRINRPERPLPSGRITVGRALLLGLTIGIFGIIFSLLTGVNTFFLALGFWIIGILYNLYLKGIPLIGNMVVSLSIAIPFIYGTFITGYNNYDLNTYILAITAFTINTYREIIKDIADIKGDKKEGLSTLPIKFGNKIAFHISLIFLFIGLSIAWIPLFIDTGLNKYVYVLTLVISEYLLIKSLTMLLKQGLFAKTIIKSKNLCMQGMLLGMSAFLFSRLATLII